MAGDLVPTSECCTSDCPATASTVGPPGAQGAAGADGADGSDGINAYTQTTANFVQPAAAANVVVAVVESGWASIGQVVFVQNGGSYLVAAKPSSTSITLTNLNYSGATAAGNTVPSGSTVSPGGLAGPTANASGTAGGDLAGSYPNPTLKAIGAGYTALGSATETLTATVDTKGRVTSLAEQAIAGLAATVISSGTLATARGGTGVSATNATDLFNQIDPLTTKGDIITRDGTNSIRLAVGADGTVLTADSNATSGLAWNARVNELSTSRTSQTTTPRTFAASEKYVAVNVAGAAVVNLLPGAQYPSGTILVVKDVSGAAATNNITVNAFSGETIDGATPFVINNNYGCLRIRFDGTRTWEVL